MRATEKRTIAAIQFDMRLRLEHGNGGVNIIMLTRFRERVRLLYTANECAKYTINGQSANAATIVGGSLPVLFCSVLHLTTRQRFRVIRAEHCVETRDNFHSPKNGFAGRIESRSSVSSIVWAVTE